MLNYSAEGVPAEASTAYRMFVCSRAVHTTPSATHAFIVLAKVAEIKVKKKSKNYKHQQQQRNLKQN